MKKLAIPFLIIVFLIASVDDAAAQRRGKKKRRSTENTEEQEGRRSRSSSRDRDEDFDSPSLAEKLNWEIKLGNLQFFNSVFQASMKGNVGYKLNNTFSAGVGSKFDYYYVNRFGNNDEGFFSYGAFGYARAKITQQLYIQGEYNMFNSAFDLPRKTYFYPSAGIGYMQVGYDWSSGFEILVPFDDNVRDFFGIVEYWFSFSKNF